MSAAATLCPANLREAEEGAAINLESLQTLRVWLAGLRSPLSEYSLANLYLYRARHDYRFCASPVPHISGVTYDGERHALPLQSLDFASAEALLDRHGCLAPLDAAQAARLAPLGLVADWNEDDSDYLFAADRLAVLGDAKTKRSQAAAFERAQSPRLLVLGPDRLGDAADILEGWLADVARDVADSDHAECSEALAHLGALGLEGRIVVGRDGPLAFLLAGRAADGSRIVHFAKGRRAHAGAYPWMFARFAREVGQGMINFEQDLGKPGFRQAKSAFAPVALLRKYRLRRAQP